MISISIDNLIGLAVIGLIIGIAYYRCVAIDAAEAERQRIKEGGWL